MNHNLLRRRITACLAAALLAGFTPALQAQDFPNRPITLVVPFPAGSITDGVTRPIAAALQEILGQTVLVDNRAGAQGVIGGAFVARSKPDGYTLLMASSTMYVGPSLYKNVPYDPIKDFVVVSGVGSTSMMFMVKELSPVKSIADLVQVSKTQRDGITTGYGSPSAQMMLAMFTNATKAALTPISYRGTPQALTDLVGGQVETAIVDIGNGVVQLNTGRLRALAISARARSSAAPNVPLLSETLPGMTLETLITVAAPAGTPAVVVERLDRAIRAALVRPEVKARFATLTTEVLLMPTAEITQLLKADIPKWEALIKAAGIELQ